MDTEKDLQEKYLKSLTEKELMGYEIAKKLNLCAIGRATNRRFFCFTAPERFLYGVEE
jgi:formate dehydrogenase assembly factor FdhD